MSRLTREDIRSMLGPVDDAVIAEVVGLGATSDDLTEARAWVTNDEALMNAGKPLPGGRVGRLVEIITDLEQDEEELARRRPT
jgi:hypothetical protein